MTWSDKARAAAKMTRAHHTGQAPQQPYAGHAPMADRATTLSKVQFPHPPVSRPQVAVPNARTSTISSGNRMTIDPVTKGPASKVAPAPARRTIQPVQRGSTRSK